MLKDMAKTMKAVGRNMARVLNQRQSSSCGKVDMSDGASDGGVIGRAGKNGKPRKSIKVY